MGTATAFLREDVFPVEFTLLFVFVTVAAALIFLGVLLWAQWERRERKNSRRDNGT